MNKQTTIQKLMCATLIMLAAHFAEAQTGFFGTYFIDTVTAASITGDHSIISNASINGDSNAIFLETANWGAAGGVYDTNAIGVYYKADSGKWALYNENFNPFQQGTAFNIVVPSTHGTAFKFKATNASANFSDIDNAATNGNPGALVFVTHNWGQVNDSSNIYENTPVGVWYNIGTSKWSIYNEWRTDLMLNETEFNVFVADTTGGNAFIHISTVANTGGDNTLINSPLTNSNPNAVIIVTHNYDGAIPHNRDSVPLGVYYKADSGKWGIFHQDKSPMQVGQSYNVLVTGVSTTGIENIPAAEMHFKVYPNPASENVNISYTIKENSDVSIKIYVTDGRELSTIYEGKESAGNHTIQQNLNGLQPGSYYVTLTSNESRATYPIVVVR